MSQEGTSPASGDTRGALPGGLADTAAVTVCRLPQSRRRSVQLRLLERAVAELSDIVLVFEADPLDEPGPRIVYVNDAFERQLGYSADEAVGRSPRFLMGADSDPATLARIELALKAELPVREVLANYTKRGERLDLEVEIVPIFDAANRCTHFVSIQRSVAERQAAAAALELSEERFRLLARATSDAVWNWDIATDKVWWGDGFHELFGSSSTGECFLTEGWAERVHPEERVEVLAGLELALMRGDPAWHAEYRFRHASGAYLWVNGRGYILRDNGGCAIRVVGGMTDISDRRSAEEQLSLLAAALDSVASPVVIFRLDARVHWLNRAFTELTGYSREDALGRHIGSLLVPPSIGGAPDGELWSALRRGEAWSGECTNSTKAGDPYPAHVTVTPVRDDTGDISHFVGLLMDRTSSALREANLIRTQRVETIGVMAAGIAHDLNNVLTPILMAVDYLRSSETDPDRLESLGDVEASAQHGAALLRQILQFARGMDGHRVQLRAAECVQEVADIARKTFPRGIAVTVHAAPTECVLLADPTQVHQVLMNLCVNARDAMPDGGKLTLSTESRLLDDEFVQAHSGAVAGHHTVFHVSDTGSGMTDEVRSHLFEPFYTSKALGTGTGLGLSTSLAIVRNHGGFVLVDTAVGVGTTFSVFFPADGTPHRTGSTTPAFSKIARGADELILVVDDEDSIRSVARKVLEGSGYRVLTAENGAEAVAQFVRHSGEIAVVIVDLVMPVLDGPSTILALKALDSNVRIIVSSGVSTNQYAGQVARAGVTHSVPKPYTASGLLSAIDRCLADGGEAALQT